MHRYARKRLAAFTAVALAAVWLDGAGCRLSQSGASRTANGLVTTQPVATRASEVSTKTYDVRFLLIDRADFPATQPAEDMFKSVVDLIQQEVDPDSWASKGGTTGAIRVDDAQLVITQSAENHRRIQWIIEQVRRNWREQVSIDLQVVSIDRRLLDKLTQGLLELASGPTTQPAIGWLDDAGVDQFLRECQRDPNTTLIATPRLILFNGQRTRFLLGTQSNYIADYTVETDPQGRRLFQPKLQTLRNGVDVELRVTAVERSDPWGDFVGMTLTLATTVNRLSGMKEIPFAQSPPGQQLMVQVPQMQTITQPERSVRIDPSLNSSTYGTLIYESDDVEPGKILLTLLKPAAIDPEPRVHRSACSPRRAQQYVPHGPGATAAFEAGLYRLDSCYARGIWPSPDLMKLAVDGDAIGKGARYMATMYVKNVVAEKYRPTDGSGVKGLRGIYDGKDAVLFSNKVDDVQVEITVSSVTLTVTFKSPTLFDWDPQNISKETLLKKITTLLAVPEAQVATSQVEVSTAEVAGITIAKGVVKVPSPEDAGKDLDGFRWYNAIRFWAVNGTLFVSVVPFERAPARTYLIRIGE